MGGQAEGLCERALPVSESGEDLPSVLQARLTANPAMTSHPQV